MPGPGSSRPYENRRRGKEVDEWQKAGLERFAFYGDKNKEALAMASIGWKKRAELRVCRRGSSLDGFLRK